MPATIPNLHVNRQVTISIKTKDWNPTALPMVGFSLQIGAGVYAVGTCPANSDGQTATVTLKIPEIHNAGNGPWPCHLRIAYCAAVQPDGHFVPNSAMPAAPIATGQVYLF